MIYIFLVSIGLCLGSFVGALTWRMRAKQLAEDKKEKQEYDKEEYRKLVKLTRNSTINDRSQCLHCNYQLKWYDLIPVLSWLYLRGRCRKCRMKIGRFEPVIEISMALFFVLSYMFWPYELTSVVDISRFIIWMISGVVMAILASYDAKWFLLPDRYNYLLIALGLVSSSILISSGDIQSTIINIAGSASILSGLYLLIYLISKGQWIGLGDVKLGLGLALLLADWRLAFIALFAANIVGTILVIPGMIKGEIKREQHIPFGPLMIIGTVVAGIVGLDIIEAYMKLIVS